MSQADQAEIDPLINSRIDGRYTVHSILGAGGMGVVYEGVHDDLGRSVAIKVLNAAWATDRTAVERFLREARTASSFSHGNIVDVTDLGRLPDGRPYLVMPRVVGVDLASMLAEIGAQPAKRVAALLAGVAAALDLVHAKGFVHRDIKPENLMYVVREDASETVMLLDFGIAAAVMSSGPRLTRQGSIFGTPHYLPPEVCAGERPDARGDVYALAAVAFEMITGNLPFPLDDIMQLMATKVTSDPPTLAAVTGQVFPAELERVIAQGMARDPKQRFSTASGFVSALHAATHDAPVSWQSGVLRSNMRSDEHVVSRPSTPGRPNPALERERRGFPTPASQLAEEPWSAHGPTMEAPLVQPPRPPSGGYGRRSNSSGFGSGRTSSPNHPSGSTRLPTGQDVSARLRVMDERIFRTAPVPMRTSWLRYVLVAAAGSVVVLALMQLKASKRDDAPDVTNTTTAPATSPALGSPAAAAPAAASKAAPAAQPQPNRPALAPATRAPVAAAANETPRAAASAAPPPSAASDQAREAALPPAAAAEPARAAPPPAAALPGSSTTLQAPAAPAPVAAPRSPSVNVRPASPEVPDYVPEPSAAPEPATPVVVMKAEEEEIPDIPVRDFAANPEPMPERRAPERTQSDSSRAAEYTREASSALLRGEVSRAVDLSRSATSADAGYGLGWRTLGLALERSGMSNDAVDAYRRYLKLAPTGQQADMVRQRVKSLGQ